MNMSPSSDQHHRARLEAIARAAMLERGLLPDFTPAALAELEKIQAASTDTQDKSIRDQRALPWCSIDNDDSRDLDQLTAAIPTPGENVTILVAVADVDATVKDGSAIDEHASHNTTSVYTAARIFPMLPEKLSTDLTSLNQDDDRLAIVIEMVIGLDGGLQESKIYRAVVRNHAKLAYNSVAAWLEGRSSVPGTVAAEKGLAENLLLQDKVAQRMKNFRHMHGALSLETIEARPVFDGDKVTDLGVEEKNRAKDLIEDFMITANSVAAAFLSASQLPSIRRVVRTPKRWDRIVELAQEHGSSLPYEPDAKALNEFLLKAKQADPLRFPDLCLAVIILMGPGEYVAETPGSTPPGHFGLAVNAYTHSTAPNRRYPDVVTQRLVKAALKNQASPYTFELLTQMALHFTTQENAANKVERQVNKSAAALLLESKIGQQFDAIVTGAADKGTWVRLLSIPVEGKLVKGFEGLDVGHRIRVQLVSVNVEQGFIDFKRIDSATR